MRAARLATLAVFVSACGSQGLGPTDTTPLALEIGTGHADGSPGFVELRDGGDVDLEAGAQGGFHVFLNVRLPASLFDDNPTNTLYIDRQARRVATNDLVSQARQRVQFERSTDDPTLFESTEPFRMFMCPTPVGVPARDEVLQLDVRALDESTDTKARAEGALKLRPRCPTGEQAMFCERICSG